MKNININVTSKQAKLVDETAQERGFANRSEFFRSLLRYIFLHSPQILTKLDAVMFEEPPTKNANYMVSELKRTGKYKKAFIKSISAGLKKSEYFNQ